MEESDDGMDEWKDLVLSPKGLFSGFGSDPYATKSIADVFSGGVGNLEGIHEQNVEKKVEPLVAEQSNSSIVGTDVDLIKIVGSIAERRAAKFGFNAPKISTPRFRSSSPLPSPGARSPYLTIPAGISPTVLLDSPIMLPNSQPSPTTGTFTSTSLDGDSQMLVSEAPPDADKGGDTGSSSMFEPNVDPIPLACFYPVENQSSVAHVDSHNSMHPPVDFEFPVQFPREVAVNNYDTGAPLDTKNLDGLPTNVSTTLQPCHSNSVASVQMQDKSERSMEEDSGTHNSLDGDHRSMFAQTGTVRTAEDGYNWRKYGQKQVKGSEYPRSYYKCTHTNCHVKKKVERSHDGQITEIIYKGAHNHPKPQPCRKSVCGSSLSFGDGDGDGSSTCVKAEGGSVWRNLQPTGSDWITDGLERTSSTSVVTEVSDPLSNTHGKPVSALESAGTPEFSSTLASCEDEDEDAATQGSFALGDDNDIEPDSKRRKKETCFVETTLGSRAVREPRVVVQIESEIDILDDGYRWRKYGQKVVKGNPNPRSYYKCTSAGCTVRKHVERASQNLKFVITTYEGKHNHEVPAARNSSHANSGNGSLPPAATDAQPVLTLPRNPHLRKTEPHVQDLPSRLDRKMECNNDFLRPNILGNLGGGASPFYQMKFPNLLNARPYVPFGLTNHHPAYPGGAMPGILDLPIPLPLGFPCTSNFGITNYSTPGRPLSSVQPLFAGHQPEESNAKLLRPKQEQADDSFSDTGMQNIEQTNSLTSSIYNHMVGTFPS